VSEQSLLHINAGLENLTAIRQFVEEVAKCGHGDTNAIHDMVLAVNEAATNVLIHGYKGKPGMIEVEVSYRKHDLMVRIHDQAPLFDPTIVPSPKTAPSLDHPYLGGMGIHLMRQLTDKMIYTATADGGNELILVKEGVRT
jgi:serine/threonine-protein kinase RsbW